MEKIPQPDPIADETIIKKIDGNSLEYWQLRNDFAKFFKRDSKAYLTSEKFRDSLENMLVMLLGREKIVPMGGQITGIYKDIFDKLLEDFSDPYKFLIKNEERNLPLFRNLSKKDTHPETN